MSTGGSRLCRAVRAMRQEKFILLGIWAELATITISSVREVRWFAGQVGLVVVLEEHP